MRMFRNRWVVLVAALIVALIVAQLAIAADVPTQFPQRPGIINTRHNMSQNTEMSNGGATMNNYRNNYAEVCVYCHTPHGANSNVAAPLWNRKLSSATYTTYDQLGTTSLTQTVYQPGAASLPCLSCHDGTQAVDAIINMPGSGQYSVSTTPWTWAATGGGRRSNHHLGLAVGLNATGGTSNALGANTSCLSCHNDGGSSSPGDATDFGASLIGTDLRNDHPIGVTFPATSGTGTDWKTPGGTKVVSGLTNRFFDETPNGRMDKGEIRLYDSGNGPSVECASCHDPHGVPSGAAATGGVGEFNFPTFLRKSNIGSAVCLTCHTK